MKTVLNKAVFLDRDGTIARDVPYCRRAEDFKIFPTVPQSIKLLKEHGFRVIVITNQSGIARGYFTEEILSQIHQKMKDELESHDTQVDAIYFCPHHPDQECACRKPKPRLLLQAAEEMGISLQFSYMVGDTVKDIEAGRAAGCSTVFVTTGTDKEISNRESNKPDYIAQNLYEAARWIIDDAESKAA